MFLSSVFQWSKNKRDTILFSFPMLRKIEKPKLLGSLDYFIYKQVFFNIKWSRLSKILIFQWNGPLENQTKWQPFFQPLET